MKFYTQVLIQRIAIILLSLSLFAPAIITISCLKYQKTKVRKQVKRMLMKEANPHELVEFTFHLKDTSTLLRWEHSKEFEYNQQMYDIVERTYVGDSVTYLCWWDHAETALNKELAAIVFNMLSQNPVKSKAQDKWLFFYKSLFCPSNVYVLAKQFELKSESPFRYLHFLSGIKLKPPFPPPDVC